VRDVLRFGVIDGTCPGSKAADDCADRTAGPKRVPGDVLEAELSHQCFDARHVQRRATRPEVVQERR
jgi:hypothetical protein